MKSKISLSIALLVAVAAAPARGLAAQGPALPPGVERVTSVEGITEYRLPNGLRVLLFPDQTKQTVTVNMTYLVGSRHEDYGETGMAHLLEHLLFKGSPKHTNIPQELTQHGAFPNGSTDFDRTNYFETFSATDENLDWALDLEADRMVNSFVARKDLDSEMTVVRNEFESGENSPFGVLIERVASTAFLWHNYGKSTIGARSDIENVPIDRLQAFYRKYYQPDNAALLVAGKFDPAKTLALVAQKFGQIPKPERVLPTIYTVEPVQDGERTVTVRRTGDTQLVFAAYHVPAGSHTDFAAIKVMSRIVGDNSPSGRLHKALVDPGKATSVFGFTFQQHDPGLVLFGAEVRKEQSLDAAREALLQTVESFATAPPTDEEVARAKTSMLKNVDLTLNDANRVGLTLSEWLAMGDWRLFFLDRDRTKAVTAADVQRVATTYFKTSNRTVGLFVPVEKPDRSEIPPTPDVAALVKDYKGEAAVAEGEAFDPSPANILSRTTTADVPGGLKITFLPKKTRGGAVFANLAVHFGDEKSLTNRSTAAEFAGSMLMRGTAKHTRQQIRDEFDRLKARAFVFGGADQAFASIETTRANLPDTLRLVAEILREPVFPKEEFDQLKQEQLAGLESSKTEPDYIANITLARHMNPYPKGDVRYIETIDEQVEEINALTLDEVKKFYTDFYGASNAELTVVGDFDPNEIQQLAASLFGSWKSPRPYTRVPQTYFDVAPLNKSFETPDKANASFAAALAMPIRDDDPDYPALVLGNYLIGGGFLNSRLASRIRQKEGLSYGVGSSLGASALDKRGVFQAFAIYAPQNVDKLETAFREEIERALKDGFTAEEVAAAKSGYLQSRQVSRAQDSGLAGRLNNYRFIGRTMQWDADFEKKISALTPDEIVAALRRHIDPSKLVIVKAGDFAGAKKQ
jgi:zinc protease